MFDKIIKASAALLSAALLLSGCAGTTEAADEPAEDNIITKAAETTALPETSEPPQTYSETEQTEAPVTEKASAEDSFGSALDILTAKHLSVSSVADEEEFGEPELLSRLREKCFSEYNGTPDKNEYFERREEIPVSIGSPEEIRFVYGLRFDLDNDGENEYIVSLCYHPHEYASLSCVTYYADGEDMTAFGDYRTDADMISELWDYGHFICVPISIGIQGFPIRTELVRIVPGEPSPETVYTDYIIELSEDGSLIALKDSYSYAEVWHRMLCTADGEFRRIGYEEMSREDFESFLELHEDMSGMFYARNSIDDIDKVYHCGYTDFYITLSRNYIYEEAPYLYISDRVWDPPALPYLEHDDSFLYGVDLRKLHDAH